MGISLILISSAGFIRPALLRNAVQEIDYDPLSNLAIGFITTVAGLAVVLSHNIWEANWLVWITILGWVMLIKGFLYMTAPRHLLGLSRVLIRNEFFMYIWLVLAFILGSHLMSKGFGF